MNESLEPPVGQSSNILEPSAHQIYLQRRRAPSAEVDSDSNRSPANTVPVFRIRLPVPSRDRPHHVRIDGRTCDRFVGQKVQAVVVDRPEVLLPSCA